MMFRVLELITLDLLCSHSDNVTLPGADHPRHPAGGPSMTEASSPSHPTGSVLNGERYVTETQKLVEIQHLTVIEVSKNCSKKRNGQLSSCPS